MSLADFRLLYAGMVDNTNPEVTEPVQEKITRRTREAHQSQRKRRGW